MEKLLQDIIFKFGQLPLSAFNKIAAITTFRSVHKGELLTERGRNNNSEYFILSGICQSFVTNPDGEPVTLSFFMDESVVSPHTTRIKDGRSMVNLKALSDLTIGEVEASLFEQLMVEDLDIRNFGNAVLRHELMEKVEKEIGLASLSAKERLAILRQKFPNLENLVPHTDIASYLGITNISLSRLRKERS